jgi:PilZ domain-containing protein
MQKNMSHTPPLAVSTIAEEMTWDRVGHRHTPRYKVALPLHYTPHGSTPADADIGWTCNLSNRGACLKLPKPFPPATRLCLTLPAAAGHIRLEAEVVWVGKPSSPGVGPLLGVHFLQVTPAQQQRLQTLLQPNKDTGVHPATG